jgi:hypothetical protein
MDELSLCGYSSYGLSLTRELTREQSPGMYASHRTLMQLDPYSAWQGRARRMEMVSSLSETRGAVTKQRIAQSQAEP